MIVAGTNFALLFAGIVAPAACACSRATRSSASYLVSLAVASSIVVVELLSADIFGGEAAVRHGVFNIVVDDDHHRVRERRLQRVDRR